MVLHRDLREAQGEMLLVRKPAGWTSFDVVNKLRGILHVRKIGHAGTLDPMATGLLIVCTGPKTKELEQFTGLEKEYDAVLRLGERTESFDAETPVVERRSTEGITEEMIRETVAGFVGFQTQLPPMWSAVKVNGRRLYSYARKGEEVERRPREVSIRSIDVTRVALPDVAFTVVCSRGTYVRTLADDIGRKLGCGAHLTALCRTRIGPYRLGDAASLEELQTRREERGLA